jgi:hypothetical protein
MAVVLKEMTMWSTGNGGETNDSSKEPSSVMEFATTTMHRDDVVLLAKITDISQKRPPPRHGSRKVFFFLGKDRGAAGRDFITPIHMVAGPNMKKGAPLDTPLYTYISGHTRRTQVFYFHSALYGKSFVMLLRCCFFTGTDFLASFFLAKYDHLVNP